MCKNVAGTLLKSFLQHYIICQTWKDGAREADEVHVWVNLIEANDVHWATKISTLQSTAKLERTYGRIWNVNIVCTDCYLGKLWVEWILLWHPASLICVIRNNCHFSRLPQSAFYQYVSMTSCLNWLLCCMITQACKASKHAVFSYGEADMGGAWMGKECSNLLCRTSWVWSQEAWFRTAADLILLLSQWDLSCLSMLFGQSLRNILNIYSFMYIVWCIEYRSQYMLSCFS